MAYFGTTRNALQHEMTKHGIHMSPVFCLHTDEELQEEVDRHPDAKSMATKWELGLHALYYHLRKRGIRHWKRSAKGLARISDEAWMRMYADASYNMKRMAADLGWKRPTILREFKRRGIHIGSGGYRRYPFVKEELEYLWNVKRLGYNLIARIYGCTPDAVENAMKRLKCSKLREPIAIIGQKGSSEASSRGPLARDGKFKMTRPNRLPSDDGWDTLPLALRERFNNKTKSTQ